MKSLPLTAILVLLAAMGGAAVAQKDEHPLSQRAANAAMARWPDGRFAPAGARWAWNYELGTLLEGMDALWLNSADPRYYNYVKSSVDQLVAADGSIPTLNASENQLDNVLLGRQLLLLYGVTQDKHYLTAATAIYQQLQHQPRTPSGGFWHKQRYPNQMWLDGLYMAEPFYAEYSSISHHPENLKDVTHQFVLMELHARDAKTGLLYHGWDESKAQRWANNETGDSPEFWARGMGWFMMALVDALDYYPEDDPGRKQLIEILNRTAAAVVRYQDPSSGLWWQVIDKAGAKGNYLESSAACMFVYALEKGVRRGYLPESYGANAQRGYQGILTHFVKTEPGGDVSLTDTVKGAGLGGEPYRDGSYEYYVGEKRVRNDPKGVGAFLLAASEMENAQDAKIGRGDTVTLDAWFNSQQRTDAFGQQVFFHYKWDTQDNPGYSMARRIFRNFGAKTTLHPAEPTVENLRGAQVYLIVSPDNVDKNPHPNYANSKDAAQIAEWVHAGGVLMMMENDTSFADLDHFNVISEKYGIHFNSVLRNHVVDDHWEMGKIAVDAGGPIFHHPHTIYVKDVCTISVSGDAKPLMTEAGDIFMAETKYGKGTVFAFVDPWLYNEYTDGRVLPPIYDNYAAGKELVKWILEQVKQ